MSRSKNPPTMSFMAAPRPRPRSRAPIQSAVSDRGKLLEDSKLTSKCQVTLPKAVRSRLDVDEGDRILWRIDDDGRILVEAADADGADKEDPAIEAFLRLLENDIAAGGLAPFPSKLRERMVALTEGVSVDLDEAIDDDVTI